MGGERAYSLPDKSAYLRRLLARAIASEAMAHSTADLENRQKLEILKELEGHVVRLTAAAKDKENTETRLIETYIRSEAGQPTNWLPPDDYEIGALDTSDPANPMLFVRALADPATIRYFVYANKFQLLEDPSCRPRPGNH